MSVIQVMEHADTAFYMGMIDMSQYVQISIMQLRAAQLIADGRFTPSHSVTSLVSPPVLVVEACAGKLACRI